MTGPTSPKSERPGASDATQTAQRVRVAVTGLASVLVLIGLGSAVFRYVSTEAPVTAVGAAQPQVVANIAESPTTNTTSEPLAELGIAPTAITDGNSTATQ